MINVIATTDVFMSHKPQISLLIILLTVNIFEKFPIIEKHYAMLSYRSVKCKLGGIQLILFPPDIETNYLPKAKPHWIEIVV